MDDRKRDFIGKFLKEFKKIATEGRGIDIVSRRKNQDSLAKLGLTKRNCRDEILSLSVTDYCDGPKPDKDRAGEIWEFGKQISGEEVYIKLKIAQVGDEIIAKCISFHVAEFPLCFPYKVDAEERGDKR